MDPSTTLVTFLFETHVSVKSVQLIGSWDNFSTWYTMKPDTRRGRGQWRGCYSFNDISSGDESHSFSPSRNGGLKMGHTYYYYYEIDGTTEAHDPARPATTACPYLPGQTVNTLYIPIEQTLRSRSASVNSLRQESYMTMDPEARFVTPVPQPNKVDSPALRRLRSASSLLQDQPTGRSQPVGSWKRFFGRNRPSDSSPCSSLQGRRTRDASPESIRWSLVDDGPPFEPAVNGLYPLHVASEARDQADDGAHDIFATLAISETRAFGPSPSPPPYQRPVGRGSHRREVADASHLTLAIRPGGQEDISVALLPCTPTSTHRLSELDADDVVEGGWSRAISSSTLTMSTSPKSLVDEAAYCFDSDDSDDMTSNTDGDYLPYQSQSKTRTSEAFQGYSLPRHGGEDKALEAANPQTRVVSTAPTVTSRGSDTSVMATNFLGELNDSGLDDFVSELGLMVDVIGKK